jgi:uncharacterized protein (TIGR00251 family)
MKIEERAGGVRFAVLVQPRASRTEVAGVHGEGLKIRLTSPPVDGAANEALVTFLTKHFAVPRHAVTIVSGARSRSKIVEIDGLSAADVRRMLNLK